jgi:Fe-S cluster biogenesis protein NfuA
MSEQREIQARMEAIERLVRDIEQVSDPSARSLSKQLVQSLMDLHGAGIERMLEVIHSKGEFGQQMIDEMGRDELVRSLLLLYGLHPLDLETRVLQALEKAHFTLRSQGANVELVRISESGAVTLRLQGNGHGCPSSGVSLHSTIERAVYDAAPDVTALTIEDATSAAAGFVSLASLRGGANGALARADGRAK